MTQKLYLDQPYETAFEATVVATRALEGETHEVVERLHGLARPPEAIERDTDVVERARPLDERATETALLPAVLRRGCRRQPTLARIAAFLEKRAPKFSGK